MFHSKTLAALDITLVMAKQFPYKCAIRKYGQLTLKLKYKNADGNTSTMKDSPVWVCGFVLRGESVVSGP